MKNYSQITFEFTEVSQVDGTSPALGVRVKSLKKAAEEQIDQEDRVDHLDHVQQPVQPAAQEAPESIEKPPPAPKKSTRGRKSLKAIASEADLIDIPADEILFQRQYYSIGEVAEMFRVNQSLLRFWESEFDIIQPRKNRKGDRHFRPIDIRNLELIYDLLRRRKLTIEGAKDFLKKNKLARERFELIQSLQKIKGFLLELKTSL